MGGLGSGFKDAFLQGQQINAQKKADMFRVAYDSYTRKKTAYDEAETKWKKSIRDGEVIASEMGLSKAAAIKAAEFLQADYTVEQVREILQTNKFVETPMPAESAQPQDVSGIDTQMQESGLNAASEINDPLIQSNTPATSSPQKDTGLLGGLFQEGGLFENAGKPPEERAAGEVRKAAGMSQEEWAQINTGFQPPPPSGIVGTPKANTSFLAPLKEFFPDIEKEGITPATYRAAAIAASQALKSGDPELVAKGELFKAMQPDIELLMAKEKASDPESTKAMAQVLNNTLTARTKLATTRGATKTVLSQSMQLDEMVQSADVNILTFTAGGAVGALDSLRQEVGAALDVAGKIFGNEEQIESSLEATLNGWSQGLLQDGVTPEIARQYREYTSEVIRYTFAVGKAMGQTGQGFSNAEYKNLFNSIVSAGNKEAFSNNLKRFSRGLVTSVDDQVEAILDISDVAIVLDDPNLGKYMKRELTPMSEQVQGSPEGQWMEAEGETQKVVPDQEVQSTEQKGLTIGTQYEDNESGIIYEYLGGDPNDQKSWKPIMGLSR